MEKRGSVETQDLASFTLSGNGVFEGTEKRRKILRLYMGDLFRRKGIIFI